MTTRVNGASRSPRAAGPPHLETTNWDPNLAHGIRHNLGTGPRYNTNTATAAVTSSNCASRRHDIQSPTTGVEDFRLGRTPIIPGKKKEI